MNRLLATAFSMLVLTPGLALAEPKIGEPAPAFSGQTASGKTVSLDGLKGEVVVLEWTNPECPFVRKHYDSGNMQALQKTYVGKGVTWLRIASSAEGKQGYLTAETAKQVAEKDKVMATDTILDASGTIGHAYEAKTTPHMFVIDKDGTLVYMGAIDSIRSPFPDDIKEAEPYVAEALDAVLAGDAVKTASTQPYGCGVKY